MTCEIKKPHAGAVVKSEGYLMGFVGQDSYQTG
jgi:hypothetical protein